MAEYDNTNSILITKNDKMGNEKAPDFRVSLDWNGEKLRAGVWLRQHQAFVSEINPKGSFMSGKVEPDKPKAQATKPVYEPGDDSDDIPF